MRHETRHPDLGKVRKAHRQIGQGLHRHAETRHPRVDLQVDFDGPCRLTGTHQTRECRDLTEIRNKAPVTHERNISEVAALEKAGYHPGSFNDDPYYPADLEAAQRQVDIWYETECPQTKPG